jgi:hypothetical protein
MTLFFMGIFIGRNDYAAYRRRAKITVGGCDGGGNYILFSQGLSSSSCVSQSRGHQV